MVDDKREDDAALEALFDAGRSHAPIPDDAFLARLATDAETAVHQKTTVYTIQPKRNILARLKGFFAASGLSGVAALGLWIGFIMPDIVTNISPFTESVTSLSAFLPGSDLSVLSE